MGNSWKNYVTGRDASGAEVERRWERSGEPVWPSQQIGESVHGQWRTETGDLGQRGFTYDAGDRSIDTGVVYDGLGRITTLPAVGDRPQATVGYFANDLAADATGTWTQRFADATDAPAWISGPDGAWERSPLGLDGQLAAQVTNTDTTLMLVDLHGDVLATASPNPTEVGVTGTFRSDEYGNPQTATPGRYGWLGGHRRQSDPSSLVLMGVRVYDPATGRFLQVDPVAGGSANDYDYVGGDPTNNQDLDGRICRIRNGRYYAPYGKCRWAGQRSPAIKTKPGCCRILNSNNICYFGPLAAARAHWAAGLAVATGCWVNGWKRAPASPCKSGHIRTRPRHCASSRARR